MIELIIAIWVIGAMFTYGNIFDDEPEDLGKVRRIFLHILMIIILIIAWPAIWGYRLS